LAFVGSGTGQLVGGFEQALEGFLGFAGAVTRKLLAFRSIAGSLDAEGTATRKALWKRAGVGELTFSGASLDNLIELFTEDVSGVWPAMAGAISYVYHQGGKPVAGFLRDIVRDIVRDLVRDIVR
jgi:hypothetical protein